MTNQKTIYSAGIILCLSLCLIIITNFFGVVHFENIIVAKWIPFIAFWFVAAILYGYSTAIEKNNFLLWVEEWKTIFFYIKSILILLAVIMVLLTMIAITRNVLMGNKDVSTTNKTGSPGILLFVFSAITAGVCEELIFRGYLLPRMLLLVKNKWLAIVISALLFGLAHYRNADWLYILFPFIIGLVFSYYYYRYRSLTTLIISHIIIDLVLF